VESRLSRKPGDLFDGIIFYNPEGERRVFMKKWFRFFAVSSVFLFLGLPAGPALAQSAGGDKEVLRMDEIVVTATRDRQEIRKVPANVTVITSEDIQQSGATSLPEVLNKLDGVHFRTSSNNPSQSQIDMRGFGENSFGRTLVLLDGRRMNRPDMSGINWLQIPINSVDRIEVVRGPGSVLYGDSSIGGTINIITKRGVGKPQADLSGIYGSYNLFDGRASLSGDRDKFSYSLNGQYQGSDGYQDRSKFSSGGIGANMGYNFSDYLDANLGISYNKTNYQLPGALTQAEFDQNPKQFQPGHSDDDSDAKYYNANLGVTVRLGSFGRLDINLLYNKDDITSNMASFPSYDTYKIETYGLQPRYILDKEIFGRGNKLTLGLDYYDQELDKDKFNNREHSTKQNEAVLKRESLGVYIRDEFNILKEMILTTGYRTERATIKGNEKDSATGDLLFSNEKVHNGEAWELGLTYLIREKSKIFVRYATVYRLPFLDEQASYYGYLGWDTFLTNLEKEKGESCEIGTQVVLFDNLKLGLTLYRINMEDEISFNLVSFRNENLDKTRHDGVELSLSWQWQKYLRILANYTYQNAAFRSGADEGKKIPLVPRDMANLILEIYLPYNLVLRPEAQYIGKTYLGSDFSNSREPLKDYMLYNLFLQYRPQKKDGFNYSAFLGVENLTDEMYATQGFVIGATRYLYPSPGITVKGGVNIGF
jgi:iron complex outermembrane recepter protein